MSLYNRLFNKWHKYFGNGMFGFTQYIAKKYRGEVHYKKYLGISIEFEKWLLGNSNLNPILIQSTDLRSDGGIYDIYEIPSLKATIKLVKPFYIKKINESFPTIDLCYTDPKLVILFIEKINEFKIIPSARKPSISIIYSNGSQLSTIPYEIKIDECDIEMNYGSEMVNKYEKIINKIKTSTKGLILLHGLPGTGKTTFIKKLSMEIGKEVIFVPNTMVELISSPQLVTFLMQRPNTVLIIEDAEKIIRTREGSRNNDGVSNILNITDGILGDCLKLQIMATFNTKKEYIDEALLRKGRLIVEHEFGALSIKESNKLLKHLGKSQIAINPMTLADIYNINDELVESSGKEISNIGFKKTNHVLQD